MTILYLHGFRSSPQSFKAQVMTDYMERQGLSGLFACPQLPLSPRESISQILRDMGDPGTATLIGSSLGGYYACYLAEKTGCRAVLLNPVVDPWKIKAADPRSPGVPTLAEWQDGLAHYGEELKAIQVHRTTRPERYLLIAATGDELLDWQQMSAHYPHSRQIIIEGSDHSLPEFPDYFGEILSFAGISPTLPQKTRE
ncbi:MAG: esterase [Burkholderiaceae bacterium]|jgi:predicted esterase YcpF (UPF0227 family)|nr:esterase [Burkholderiaceae bacterium]